LSLLPCCNLPVVVVVRLAGEIQLRETSADVLEARRDELQNSGFRPVVSYVF